MTEIAAQHCHRLHGGSVKDCACRLPNDAGWLECPPEARGVPMAEPMPPPPLSPTGSAAAVIEKSAKPKQLAGDLCQDCGSANLQRAGTCLLCADCGSTSGGCS